MKTHFIDNIYQDKNMNALYDRVIFTPMMQEWKDTKEYLNKKYWKNTVLFFQVWTFYEAYFHDALIISRILWFTLTKKNKNKKDSIPMAWMPLVADKEKLSKLLDLNLNIVFVSEYNNQNMKNWIWRKISKIITPSTNLDYLDKNNNFLLSIYEWHNKIWLSLLDISTGIFKFLNIKNTEYNKLNILFKYNISEVIINKEPSLYLKELFKELNIAFYNITKSNINHLWLIEFQMWTMIKEIEIYWNNEAIIASAEALNYAKSITQSELEYISDITDIEFETKFKIDKNSIQNLELVKNYSWWIKNSLYWIINNTVTPFWSRELRNNILTPFTDKDKINNRLEQVDYFYKNQNILDEIRLILSWFYDIEKLAAKLGNNSINPIDLQNLAKSMSSIKLLSRLNIENKYTIKLIQWLNDYDNFINIIKSAIKENPSINIKEWNIFNWWYNVELDKQRNIFYNIENILLEKEDILQKETGIKWLKIINNNNWFFIEIRNTETNKIPSTWFYKKTLNNTTRYSNEEIDNLNIEYKLSEIEIKNIEYNLFQELRIELSKYINSIFSDAKLLAEIDIVSTFTYNANYLNYNKPIIWTTLNIKNWRHPIIEVLEWRFKWNDTIIADSNIKIITGPNMGWKSTYLKQNALIYILFQIWSYIPADEYSSLTIIDWIYTRIGASDNLELWLSTFAVEMNEMWYICNNYNNTSLVLIDEIWRWTDNINWLALAKAFLDYFINNNKWYIFFSTHYSELLNDYISNNNIEVLKAEIEFWKDWDIKFLHKISPWIETNSYGIEIAELYNIPNNIIEDAKNIRKKRTFN